MCDAGFYASKVAENLRAELRASEESKDDFDSLDMSCYEVGFDFAQMFATAMHSTGALFIR